MHVKQHTPSRLTRFAPPTGATRVAVAPSTPPTPRGERKAYAFVDALRGVAALLVLFFHVQLHVVAGYPGTAIVAGSPTDWFVFGRFDLG